MSALEPDDPRSVGEYRLLGRLGVGGMGRVFLGRSPGGRLVAVKVVHAELVRRPEFRDRFRREVQAARMVSGAFTAPVVDADPDAPLPWLVTSYIAGPSLDRAVAERGPFEPGAVLALAAGLAEALVSIHAANLVHRDLKPSNVLLAEDGPRVIDFGIVRSVDADSVTTTGHMAGSPGFMSPEQVNGDEVGWASDVFCLGAVLAFAATGANPFGGGPTPALLYRVVHNAPDVDAVTDPALRALIGDCLAKDPARRPTPRAILARIGPLGGESTTAAPHAGQWAPAVGPARTDAAPTAVTPAVGPAVTPVRTDAVPTLVAPPPAYPATRVDTARPAPRPPDTRPTAPGERGGGRGRRAFLLSGAGAIAALGVGTGFWLNRSPAPDDVGASPTPSPSPSAATPLPPEPVGRWALDEASGTIARDTAGGHDATATGVAWQPGGAGAAFDGTGSQMVTEGPVLKTGAGRSFTVAAWVRLSAVPGTFATAVSQDSGTASGFYLQYSSEDNGWAFSRPGLRAVGRTAPAAHVWTHLAGVCDGPARRLRLYVNGVEEAVVEDTDPLPATGPFVIGRASYDGQPRDFFPGAIRDVRAFDRALDPAGIRALTGSG
ncbi:protein kinase domain-containing protein [Streptomyces lancefieldiae]|uniref:LamG-like jellyroll fold domain-containing protein n=1 Tax=Streptomyces lancefieldiae TaxID=3075520 RepID=A0ABU3ATP8_9ACTN|nr:LamG-like jellyroll fold domain-containing protein [Streptomyces sp. DSM 40712]MDT0613540.1 LamG-like jellyroll fold domain-containing protein [Streptomyces sp. DSM 40712]